MPATSAPRAGASTDQPAKTAPVGGRAIELHERRVGVAAGIQQRGAGLQHPVAAVQDAAVAGGRAVEPVGDERRGRGLGRDAVIGAQEIRRAARRRVVQQGAGAQVGAAVHGEDHPGRRAARVVRIGNALDVDLATAGLPDLGGVVEIGGLDLQVRQPRNGNVHGIGGRDLAAAKSPASPPGRPPAASTRFGPHGSRRRHPGCAGWPRGSSRRALRRRCRRPGHSRARAHRLAACAPPNPAAGRRRPPK